MAGNNLKTRITADTSQFNKEVKGAKAALKDFEKQGSQSLTDIAGLFGLDSGAVQTLSRNITNCTNLFRKLGSEGTQATNGMKAAMVGLQGAIAGLGIAYAIAAFKELNAEAKNFEERLQGVNLAATAKAARDAFKQSLYDQTGAGEGAANFLERTKTRWSMGWNRLITGSTYEQYQQAVGIAQRAGKLANDMVEYKRQERDLSVEIQEIDNKIEAAQNTFKNRQATIADRKAAEATITELVNQKYDRQIELQGKILANIQERNSLTTSTEAELDEEANQEKKVLGLEGARQRELNSLLRTSNSIAGAAKKTHDEVKETVSLLEQVTGGSMADQLNKIIEGEIDAKNVVLQRVLNEGDMAMFKNMPSFDNQASVLIPAKIIPKADTAATQKAIIELTDVIQSGVEEMSDALGGLIGDLINGENAWGNFAQAGIAVIADMLATVGRAFIAEGTGVIAAQLALKSGNGAAAIAGGAAMVAIAAAMKSTMSNAAANWGGGGYSTSVASSAYTSGAAGPSAFGREMEVKVTGTLTANGSKLVAVLNNENDRKNYTT